MQDKTVIEDGKKWAFDEEVTAVFDNMLERSIPQYEAMRELVKNIGFEYAKIGSYIVDLGCSNGNAISPFVHAFGEELKYLMMDVSDPMLKECKERYKDWEKFGCVEIIKNDITQSIPDVNACLVLSILTLQFTPIEYRQKIVSDVYRMLDSGGAFIFVEKVLGNTNELDSLFVREYYRIKSQNQYTQEQIQSKRKSLEGVLVPITARWNEDMLKQAGFRKIDCFWRCLNFAGWIAIK